MIICYLILSYKLDINGLLGIILGECYELSLLMRFYIIIKDIIVILILILLRLLIIIIGELLWKTKHNKIFVNVRIIFIGTDTKFE